MTVITPIGFVRTLYLRTLFVETWHAASLRGTGDEALATGLPVIATTGTPWQELEKERCGWWITLTVDNLVKAIAEALQLQPEELKAMGARGRKLVEDKYEIGAVARQMKEFYETVFN